MRRIAIQGERGSYSEAAVRCVVGTDGAVISFRENSEVTRSVAAGEADLGLLPIENSLAGSVIASYDAILAEPALSVVGEVILPIHHCLLGLRGASLDAVRSVESHPVALAQCRRFLAAHPELEARASHDTAGAAREVAAAGDPRRAAIAGSRAAAVYGLDILASDIEDRDDNVTRFLLLGVAPAVASDDVIARTMLAYTTANRPGALLETLAPLAAREMNMVKIESRPAGTPWSYRFIVEFEHRGGAAAADLVVAALRPFTDDLRHLGTFLPAVPGQRTALATAG